MHILSRLPGWLQDLPTASASEATSAHLLQLLRLILKPSTEVSVFLDNMFLKMKDHFYFFFFLLTFTYLAELGLSCDMWDLVP